MNLTKSAKILISCGLFLLTLFFTSYFDLSLTVAVSTYLLLSGKDYLYLFIASLIVFLLGIVLQSFEVSIRYIFDLLSDAYILFVTGVILYLKSKKDFIAIVHKYYESERKRFSKKIFFQVCLGIVAALLFSPIFGGYLASALGYVVFFLLSRQFSGKIAITIGFLFLMVAAVFLLSKKDTIAEELGNYTYFFLVIGTVQEVINFVRQRKEDDINLPEKQDEQLHERINFTFPSFSFPKINPRILLIIAILLIVSFLLYFYYPVISKYKFSLPILSPTLTPTPTVLPNPLPTIIPTPITKVSTSAAQLKILVLNGAEIAGLAGSTSAKLKKVGFRNIEIGNAETSDYKTWEVFLKKPLGEEMVEILKNILELDALTVKEASAGAKYDIEIIGGEEK